MTDEREHAEREIARRSEVMARSMPSFGRPAKVPAMEPERRWAVTLDCGHTNTVSTMIGDFDYAKAHEGLPVPCFVCRHDLERTEWLRNIVEVRQIPREEWD
jgi:hypothetical protein